MPEEHRSISILISSACCYARDLHLVRLPSLLSSLACTRQTLPQIPPVSSCGGGEMALWGA